jgi:hypothetical protein
MIAPTSHSCPKFASLSHRSYLLGKTVDWEFRLNLFYGLSDYE